MIPRGSRAKLTIHDGGQRAPVCPYFGSNEEGCDVGMPHSTAHDVELMVSFCNGKFEKCSRYRMLSERDEGVTANATQVIDPDSKGVVWDVLQHELRTPLAAILTASEILKSNPDRDVATRSRFVNVINEESTRMKKTVEDLFNGLESTVEPVVAQNESKTNSMQDEPRRNENMDRKKRWNQGWSVVLAGTGINLALGILYTWSIFKNAIRESIETGGANAFNWDMSAINDPYAVCCLVFAFAMIVAGRFQDRFGPRLTAMVGGTLVGLGFIMMSVSSTYWAWVTGFGVLAGLGIGFGYSAATPPALKWFPPARTGLIAGIVVSGFGLASVYIAPLAKYLLGVWGLQKSMLFFGVSFFFVVGLLSLFLKNPPQTQETKDAGKKNAKALAESDHSTKEMLKSPAFYVLWLCFFVGSGAGLMVIGSIAGMAKASLGEMAFVAVAVLAIGNAAGRIVAGVLSDKIGRGLTLTIMMLFQSSLMFAAVPIMGAAVPNATLLVSLTGLIGFNYGTNLSLFPSFTKDRWGLANFGTNYGVLFSAWGVSGFVMGRVSQMFVAKTGNFDTSFLAASAMLLAGSFIALTLEESRKPLLKLVSSRSRASEKKEEAKRKAA